MNVEGCEVVRVLDTMDSNTSGGHSIVDYTDVRVPKEAILGEPGKGFRYAQVRLAPARLTHCMRWLGAARRCHDIAVEYARNRHAFGKPISEHEGVSFQLADNLQDLHQSRLSIWHTAWVLDQGERGGNESSMAKVFCSEAVGRVVDRSVQILGGTGICARPSSYGLQGHSSTSTALRSPVGPRNIMRSNARARHPREGDDPAEWK